MATWMSPEVAFLNPTGQETPETSWRWTWLSVVRAPMAPQLTRPAMYCGRDHVEEFGAGGDAHLGEVEEKVARETEAVVDLVGAVEMRIVDEALPADGGAGLLKVDAHDDVEVGGEFGDCGFKQGSVFDGGGGVVDGAWADEDEEARVAMSEDAGDGEAGIEDGGNGFIAGGAFLFEEYRGKDYLGPLDANVFDALIHGFFLCFAHVRSRELG